MDSLPSLDEPYPLTEDAKATFARDGHAVVPGLASRDELAVYRPPLERAAVDGAWDTRPIAERDTYGKAFLQSFNLWERSEGLRAFTFGRRFARVAAALLDVEGVRLYHDQALFKEPGGGRTPWHQDQHYWPLGGARAVTMWMALADVPPEIGTMTFVSGTHRMGNLVDLPISDESEAAYDRLIGERGWATATHGALGAGDATFHDGWTLHSAGPNPTDRMRPAMTVIYVDADAVVAEPANDSQRLDLAVWLPGLEAGDGVDSPKNPVLWP